MTPLRCYDNESSLIISFSEGKDFLTELLADCEVNAKLPKPSSAPYWTSPITPSVWIRFLGGCLGVNVRR